MGVCLGEYGLISKYEIFGLKGKNMKKGLDHFKNRTIAEMLRKMAEWIQVDPNTIDFGEKDWFLAHAWTRLEQEAYREWLMKWLLEDKKRIDDIANYPSMAKRNKKELMKVIDWYLLDFGWRGKG